MNLASSLAHMTAEYIEGARKQPVDWKPSALPPMDLDIDGDKPRA